MSSLDKDTRASYWRSLEAFEAALDSDPALRELVENEFPEQAEDLFDPPSRRRFLQLMGASLALAGVAGTGCHRWEKEEIVPLSQRPEGYVPGVPRHFATALELGGVADGVVVTSFDGRPIKVEGNAQHPFGTGATTSFAQASVLHLYDPDRSQSVRRQDGPGNWDDFETFVRSTLVGKGGAGLRFLSEATSSPTLAVLRDAVLAAYPQARWHEYEPLSLDNERLGTKMAMGQALRPIAHLDRARVIVALDADLFATHPARLRYARDFAKGRGNAEEMNRLYAVESSFSSAGVAADHRLPLPSSHMPAFLDALVVAREAASALGNAGMGNAKAMFDRALAALNKSKGEGAFAVLTDSALRFVAALAQDLADPANRYRSILVAGPGQSPEVHAKVALLNAALGANGRTLEYRQLPDGDRPSHMESIKSLAADMQAGQVQTLVVLGGNPVYNAPADVDFAAALAKVGTSIHLSEYFDETSAACTWHLPRAHYLESWGDARTYDGTVSLIQPLIEPMWLDDKGRGSKTPSELLALLLGRGHVSGEDLVRKTFSEHIRPGLFSATDWRKALQDGFVEGSAYPVVNPPAPRAVPSQEAANLGKDNLEVVFVPSSHTFDGRFANNAWLQETPDFITKLTWDNAALINPNTADELGIRNGDLIDVEAGGRRIQVAAYTLPGQARGSIALALGHGRTRAGRVGGMPDDGVAPTGFDTYKLRASAAPFVATGAAARAKGGKYALVTTQDHWNFPDSTGRKGVADRAPSLIREVSVADRKNASAVAKLEHDVVMPGFVPAQNGKSLWDEHDYDGPRSGSHSEAPRHKWGMAIDLDKCTGCNACMLACQSENNVPVVGKAQVAKSREMHWLRIDRYFVGDDLKDNPRIAHQPVACQQCENAPCEQVCPVGATIHTEEGLNDMVYNRCVGTRYCLNNCPYRVRRFNFLDYLNRSEAPGGPIRDARNKVRQLLFNPEVTVRSRGVMEKCTFCVQRIQNKKIVAKNERRELRDGEIQSACMQACPTGAIVFGDLNDKRSMVTKAHDEPRSYALLNGLNTKPRNLFLARIRNPNPQLG